MAQPPRRPESGRSSRSRRERRIGQIHRRIVFPAQPLATPVVYAPAMRLLPLAFLLLPVLSLHAADPAPKLAERGKQLFSDDMKAFDTKSWSVAKGKWEAADGATKGAELPADNHP